MDRRSVSRTTDNAVERIDLPHEMTLAEPPDRWIAAHGPDLGEIETHQRRSRTHARRSASRLDTGMTAADDYDIETLHGRPDTAKPVAIKVELRKLVQPAMFHVKHLFSDAEPTEQGIEHILGRMASLKPIKCQTRGTQLLGNNQRIGP